MNNGLSKILVLLTSCAAMAGCATPQTGNSILSAADADRMIKVDVRESAPEREPVLIAAVNPAVE